MAALDFGQMRKLTGSTMLAFWVGVAIVLLRRPMTPTRGDIVFVRFGFPIALFFVLLATALRA